MIKEDSKTLRVFNSTITKNGKEVKIKFGYDASNAGHSGFFILVDKGDGFRYTKKSQAFIRSLKCEELNDLMSAIGTDVYGAPYGFSENYMDKLLEGDYDYFRCYTDEDRVQLDDVRNNYMNNPSNRTINAYIKSRRIEFIEMSKKTIRGIMDLHNNSIEYNGVKYEVELDTSNVPKSYQKRDIDYVRKARVKLFETVLKRKYRPLKR
jgi:hypothetical protein